MGGTREKEAHSCPQSHLDLLTLGLCNWPGLEDPGELEAREIEELGESLWPVGAVGGTLLEWRTGWAEKEPHITLD